MVYRIEIIPRDEENDIMGLSVLSDIHEMGINEVEKVRFIRVFLIEGDFSGDEIQKIAEELLIDKVLDQYAIGERVLPQTSTHTTVLEVTKKPGVIDPVEQSTLKGIRDLGLEATSVRTAKRFHLTGDIPRAELELIASKILANESIEEILYDGKRIESIHLGSVYKFVRKVVPIREYSDAELMSLSKNGQLFLNLKEMQTIKEYFVDIGRNPTDVELETLAQTWSEHCVHKTLKSKIDYDGSIIDNLLKSTIARVTKELDKEWCVSVFVDNAGVITFDEDNDVCFKVETHNHPSALEPYGGAGTGIGGVIRDILGTGLGAKPVANTDVFCFGPPDYPMDELPAGTLHPKVIAKGVVAGVRDYGNKMGIPTVSGAVYFDERFIGNPLVYCGTIGILPKGKAFKKAHKDDLIVLVGGKTGRDGIHGATFSSGELTEESESVSSGCVQIGNPIVEKKVTDTLLVARDENLYTAITDCGAGGLSSAVGEMGETLGAEVHLERVPLKYEGLTYTEIWISEAQERMVLAVPEDNLARLTEIFDSENVESTVIGRFTGDKRLKLFYDSHLVCDLDMDFLHNGLPQYHRKATWKKPRLSEPQLKPQKDYTEDLKKILDSWNVCSKEWIVRQYDHEVQGASVLKPLVGIQNDGPGDASIIAPVLGSSKGVIVACGLNPKYSDLDTYHMAANAIDEALRQIISVGGTLEKTALLDNFCWGNTDRPEELGKLVRACQACYDIATVYGTPFISGKDSLNNEYATRAGTIIIPGCLLISAISVMDDVCKAVTMDFKKPGNLVYMVGLTKNELGGSHFYAVNGHLGANVPQVDAVQGKKIMDAVSNATQAGLVKACHDLSEGGLAVAISEMAFAGGWGAKISLAEVPCAEDTVKDYEILFSESPSRFLVEVAEQEREVFEEKLKDVPFGLIGKVSNDSRVEINNKHSKMVISADIEALKQMWQNPLKW